MSMETSCPPVMGNGIVDGCEECDDGNLVDGDGCNSDGRLENSAMRNNAILAIAAAIFYIFF